ncbi:hypothetical protein [Pyxidicoccus caerfyrddinensis]|uniref:hypothetical protein n=1 Tax=Pyxidicoccus caerfyrddinensis TaxID=2709663 RepID=UPI0013D97062|nr:hypothetical protein [Pyxidicoccus caerfyrddinensis]
MDVISGIFTALSWLLLGIGLFVDGACLVLLVRALSGQRAASGVPLVSLVCYGLWFNVQTTPMGPHPSGWLLLGLFLFHVVVQFGLAWAFGRTRGNS